jgi:intracellular sulfur oxidation DsrE/DsrF family protein
VLIQMDHKFTWFQTLAALKCNLCRYTAGREVQVVLRSHGVRVVREEAAPVQQECAQLAGAQAEVDAAAPAGGGAVQVTLTFFHFSPSS